MPAIITLLNPHRRGSKRRRRGNPGSLLIVNGKRRSNMARRRRRTTTRRRKAVTNPRRRRRTPVTHRRRRRRAAPRTNRRRRSLLNPRRHHRRRRVNRSHRRRRNPSGILAGASGLLEQAITAIVGMSITDFAYGFVGGMNPAGPVGQIGIKLGIAIGLRMAANKFGFSRSANMLAVGGAVSAGKDALNYFVGGGGLLFPSAAPAPAGRQLVPVAMTGDDAGGGQVLSDIVSVPPNWGNLGEIVSAPTWQGYYQ
jgi:hypothetical protein